MSPQLLPHPLGGSKRQEMCERSKSPGKYSRRPSTPGYKQTQLHNLLPRESNTSNKQYSAERAKTLVSLEWAGSGGTGEPGEAQGSSHHRMREGPPTSAPHPPVQSWPRRRLILLLGNLGFSYPHPVKGGVN